MQPVLPDPIPSAIVSLSVQPETFIGVNNIRKSVGRANALWLGSGASTREVLIAASATFTVSEQVKAFIAVTSGPLTVTVNSKALACSSLLVLDEPVTSGGLVFHNAGTTPVQLELVYLNP